MSFLALLRRIGGTVIFMVGVVSLALPIIPGWFLIGVGLYLLSVDSPGMQQRIAILRVRHRHLNALLTPIDRLLGHATVSDEHSIVPVMTHGEFVDRLHAVADRDTSADPDNWSPANPVWGHCAVVALLAQDLFGGTLVRGSLDAHPRYRYLRSHFWNQLDDGTTVDFTGAQFEDLSYGDLEGEVRTRDRVLDHPDTKRRYELLYSRFHRS